MLFQVALVKSAGTAIATIAEIIIMKAILITAAIIGAVIAVAISYSLDDISDDEKDLDDLFDETTNAFDNYERDFDKIRRHPRESFT
jgi:hypothetical protein